MKAVDSSIYEKTGALSNGAPTQHTKFDVVILGAGAAGLMCARTASARGLRVVLVDHAPSPGRKIGISGGGKANFTNLHMDASHYVGQDPAFCEPALSLFSPQDIQRILAAHRLAWEEREHGQLFGLSKAAHLVDALVQDCAKGNCLFSLEHVVENLQREGGRFAVAVRDISTAGQNSVRTLTAPSLVLALGSPAWPQVGASDAGARWARRFGHKVLPFRPVLAPLHMPPHWPLRHLSGISCKVSLRTGDYTRTDDALFTHTGLSGPAVLQISCRWQPGQEVYADFLPHVRFDQVLDAPGNGKLLVRTLLCRHLPQRLADALLPEELARRKSAELSRAARTALRDCVHQHVMTPQGTEGLRRAEAAAGGVSTVDVDPWSMQSRLTQGLFVVGELLDVTGHLGGYNLHWAWASGYAAGLNV